MIAAFLVRGVNGHSPTVRYRAIPYLTGHVAGGSEAGHQNHPFCSPPLAIAEQRDGLQIGGSVRVLPGLPVTQRDAVCQRSRFPPLTRRGVTGPQVAVGPKCLSTMAERTSRPLVAKSCLT